MTDATLQYSYTAKSQTGVVSKAYCRPSKRIHPAGLCQLTCLVSTFTLLSQILVFTKPSPGFRVTLGFQAIYFSSCHFSRHEKGWGGKHRSEEWGSTGAPEENIGGLAVGSSFTLNVVWQGFIRDTVPTHGGTWEAESWVILLLLFLPWYSRKKVVSEWHWSVPLFYHMLWDHKQLIQLIWPSVKWDNTSQGCHEDHRKYFTSSNYCRT